MPEDEGLDTMTDAQLAALSRQGNREAFGVLAGRWDGPLYGFLRRVLGDEELARDACQETLLRAYVKLPSLREPAAFKTWLHTIALNLCRDRGRSPILREVALDHAMIEEPAAGDASPLDRAQSENLATVLHRVLARLPIEQRSAIVLREFEGFTSQEIATMTGVPAATVRSRIFYGLKALRKLLPEYGITPAHVSDGGTLQ
jgi:RNA polymerase sigma-70 factor (ECF subfamily)